MSLAAYRLLVQTGAGPDGVSYRAEAPGEEGMVEVRVLAGARAEPARWPLLVRQLRRAVLFSHPAAVRLRRLELDHEPPYLVLPWLDGPTLAEALSGQLPLPAAEVVTWGLDLGGVLLTAHRLGLAHGALAPEAVRLAASRQPRLDFSGTRTCPAGPVAADPAEDVAALGRLLRWMLGEPSPGPLADLLRDMLADPGDRPTMQEVNARLGGLLEHAGPFAPAVDQTVEAPLLRDDGGEKGSDAPAAIVADLSTRQRLGRFRLLEKLGAGGMGEVYRGEDLADGRIVALKVLRPEWSARPAALRRFHKEARLLAEVNSPHVTNLLEVNEDDGIHYLALEFVAGHSLGRLLDAGRPLQERFALAVIADVCRALAEAHRRGIVHRDIKPDNILVFRRTGSHACPGEEEDRQGRLSCEGDEPLAKLSDFGLARHVVESESLHLTRTGAVIGTPLYLSPEQCTGSTAVGPRSDVYGLGATLFHALAGRPPFLGEGPLQLIAQHTSAAPPALGQLNPAVSEGACRLVEKALAKKPEHRHADAGEFLRDVERLLRGEPANLSAHPRLPPCDPGKVLHYDFRWELQTPPERLWPFVSNTERLNRAIGLPAVQYTTRADENGRARRDARARKLGMEAAWQEHPFEWVEGRRFGVLREFTAGPLRWLVSQVELAPNGGGTLLTHSFRIEPAGLLGRTVVAVEVGLKTRRALERVYRRIDTVLSGQAARAGGLVDPFEEPASLTRSQRQHLDEALDRLAERGVEPTVAERLGDFLAVAPPQEVARIRPLALARRLGLDAEAVVAACLHGAREGLLVLLWDLLCPICRIPSEVQSTLRALRDHGRCEACNLDYQLDFAGSVELIFRAHPAIRDTEVGTYCVGGPAHSPHVAAQVRIAPGERVELDLALPEGAYRLRGPQLPVAVDFRVRPDGPLGRWEVDLAHGLPALKAGPLPVLHGGAQVVVLEGAAEQELVVRLERTAPRDDALTAARASALALFRELFPGEVLAPGQLVGVAAVTLLVTDVEGVDELYERLGETKAFGLLHDHLRALEGHVRAHGGAFVKAVGEGTLSVFHEPLAAVRAALSLPAAGRRVRAGAHRGPALAATLNDHLDYFGPAVRQALQLPRLVRGGECVLSQAVMDDPQVAELLREHGLAGEVFRADLPSQRDAVLHRFRAGALLPSRD